MFLKRVQLGLVHVAITMTLIPINSALNRVMIKELALSAALVAALASLPYLFSPIQVAIGSFSDRNPIFGWRRTPYILLGLLFCVAGVIIAPYIAYLMAESYGLGLLAGLLAFGAWGMGFNFAAVSYFSLATELSGHKGRARTVATMFFMMVVSIIITSYSLGGLLEPYTRAALISSFRLVGVIALALGLLGLLGLETRGIKKARGAEKRYIWKEMYRSVRANRQVALFFGYLILLLVAILGQDILLEPYGAEAFGLSVSATTRITSIWGTFFLISLSLGGALENRVSKLTQARIGGWSGVCAFVLIVLSSMIGSLPVFYFGVILLGFATGLATVSNLALMLDMTAAERVGLFIGIWGMANAISRLAGNLLAGVVRDGFARFSGDVLLSYQTVFVIQTIMLASSLWLLRLIDVASFRRQASRHPKYAERAALAGDS